MDDDAVRARASYEHARAAAEHAATEWYTITNAGGSKQASVYIYDAIGGWFGIAASDFVAAINALTVDTIDLHLNSPGGQVFDGLAIYNSLRQHKAAVNVTVDGLAASAASIVAMAGDTVTMARGSQMMIHDAQGVAIGPAADMRDMADILDKISGSLAEIYQARAGDTADVWRTRMKAETWYTAAEAVDAGLADHVDAAAEPQPTNTFDLSMFAYAGRDTAPAPTPHSHPATEPGNTTTPTTEGEAMSATLIKGLSDRLGITDSEPDEATILAALDEVLAESETTNPTPVPTGTIVVDEAAFAQLKTDAELGRDAAKQLAAQHREQVVTAAINAGRIPSGRREHWTTQLEADPGAEAILTALPENTVPLEPVGYTGGVDEATDSDDDQFFAHVFPEGESNNG